jgi:amino-acid N-acetyltransferase
MQVKVRKAKLSDAEAIHSLINLYYQKGVLLPRSLASIYEHIRDFWVYEEDGEIIACCALQVVWEDLAEIRSLAVKEGRRGEGIGRKLVKACLKEAEELGIKRVFSLTYEREFFASLGFKEVDKGTLPHKVWNDCVNCVKFPSCDEVAVLIELNSLGELQRLHGKKA